MIDIALEPDDIGASSSRANWARHVVHAMSRLSVEHQRALRLVYVERRTPRDAAMRADVTIPVLTAQLAGGLQALAAEL